MKWLSNGQAELTFPTITSDLWVSIKVSVSLTLKTLVFESIGSSMILFYDISRPDTSAF